MRRYPRRVENYTNPFLAVSALLLFMTFFTMAATVGLIPVIVCAALIELVLRLAEMRRIGDDQAR